MPKLVENDYITVGELETLYNDIQQTIRYDERFVCISTNLAMRIVSQLLRVSDRKRLESKLRKYKKLVAEKGVAS